MDISTVIFFIGLFALMAAMHALNSRFNKDHADCDTLVTQGHRPCQFGEDSH